MTTPVRQGVSRFGIPVLVVVLAILPFLPNLCRPGGITSSRHSDVLSQDVPWRHYMAEEREATGSLPTWNPVLFSGVPTVENLVIPLFYPPFAPLVLEKAQWQYSLLFALHTAWMALGAYFLARRLGAGRASSGFAGLAFAAGARMMGHAYAGHLMFTAEISWLPWILLLADRLPTRPRSAFLLALALGAMLLCGHPQLPFYTILVAGIWVCARSLTAESGRLRRVVVSGLAYAGAVAGGFVVGAAQFLPSYLFSQEAGRSGGVDLAFADAYTLGPLSLIGLLLPLPLGHPEIGTYWGPPNYWELCAYLGIPAIVLALIGFRRSGGLRARWLALGVLVGAVVFAMGTRTPLFPFLFRVLPGLDHFRVPARAMIFAALMAVLLATRGLDALREAPGKRDGILSRRVLPILAGLTVLAAAIWAVAGGPIRDAAHEMVRSRYGADQGAPGHSRPIEYWLDMADRAYLTMRTSLGALAVLLAGTVLIIRLRTRERIGRDLFVVLLTVLLMAEGLFVGWRFLAWRRLPDRIPVPEYAVGLRNSGGRFRVLDQTGALSNSVSMSNRIEQVGGYDPTIPRRYMDYVAGMAGLDREPLGTTIAAERLPVTAGWRRWWLDWLNTGFVLSHEDITDQGFRLVGRGTRGGREVLLFENPDVRPRATLHGAWRQAADREEATAILKAAGDTPVLVVEGAERPPLDAASGSAEVTEYGSDRVVVRTLALGASMLLLADSWSAGWKATVDGEPAEVHPANMALRAVFVPPGRHVVEMRYEPRGHPLGLWITAAGVVLLFGAWVFTSGGAGTRESRESVAATRTPG